jgi:hypothetical protein
VIKKNIQQTKRFNKQNFKKLKSIAKTKQLKENLILISIKDEIIRERKKLKCGCN